MTRPDEPGDLPASGAGAPPIPVTPGRWRRWADIEDLFRGPADPAWDNDREGIDQALRNPWAPR